MEETTPTVEGGGPQESEPNPGQWDVQDDGGQFQQERQRRVQECRAAALAKEDPLAAVLGSINAGLIQIGIALDHAINEDMAAGPATVERIMQHSEAVELHLKLTRQIDRFAQLELRPAGKPAEQDEPPPRAPR